MKKVTHSINRCSSCGEKFPFIGFRQKFIWRGWFKKSAAICSNCNHPSVSKIDLKSALLYLPIAALLIIIILKVLSFSPQTQKLRVVLAMLIAVIGIRKSYKMVAAEKRYTSKPAITFTTLLIKKLIIVILTFVVTINLMLFISLQYFIPAGAKEVINVVPEKLRIEKQEMEGETLHLMGYKFVFPFYSADIKEVKPSFTNNKKLIDFKVKILNNNEDGYITFSSDSNNFNDTDGSSNKTLKKAFNSEFEMLQAIHYARLKDFSLWNVRHNMFLTMMLITKAIATSQHAKSYDIETPHIRGLLDEYDGKRSIRTFLTFPCGDRLNTISFINFKKDSKNYIRNIISTIQPIENIEGNYDAMRLSHEGTIESPYPVYSAPCRPPVPEQGDHLFRGKATTYSDMKATSF